MSAHGRIHERQSGSNVVMTCIAVRSHVLCVFLPLLFEGCRTECCLSDTAANTCRRDGMGSTARGRLDDILAKSLNIWAVSMGHSQLWGVYEWRDKQNATPYSFAGLSVLFQHFLAILSVSAVSLRNTCLHHHLFIIIGVIDQMGLQMNGTDQREVYTEGFFQLVEV
jgi:hypothetical protein